MSDEMSALRRDFSLSEYATLAKARGVTQSVQVQSRQSLDENLRQLRQIEDHAADKGLDCYVVGWVDLLSEAAESQLVELAAHPRVVGIRHFLSLEPTNGPFESQLFKRGLAVASSLGLTFDLLVRPDQLVAAETLIASLPEVTFVLDHLGNPPVGDDLGSWQSGITSIASHSNVSAKLSGLMTAGPQWSSPIATLFTPEIEFALESFGSDRLMFGSDWPVVTLKGGLEVWLDIVMSHISQLSRRDQEAILGGNARRTYSLDRATTTDGHQEADIDFH